MLTSDRPISRTLITWGLGYLMKLFAYYFLSGMVLLTLTAFIAAYIIIIGPEMPFLKYFSFILPTDENGTVSMGTSDFMRLYNFMTLALFLLSTIGRRVMLSVKRLLQSSDDDDRLVEDEPPIRDTFWQIKRRFFVNSLIITGIYMVSFFAFPFANLAEGTSLLLPYAILATFYIFAMMSNVLYVLLDSASNNILATVSIFR